jgi:hypothetical protein
MNDTNAIRERAGRGGLPDIWRDEVYGLLEEIKRLQEKLTDAEQVRDQRLQMAKDAIAELDRLQAELDGANRRFAEMNTPTARKIELQAEIFRLQRLATDETERCMEQQEIVDQLRKTEDGEYIIPGHEYWTLHFGKPVPWLCWSTPGYADERLFSTRDAAEKARTA